MSLGASRGDVLRMVFRQATQAFTGTVSGVAGAVLLSKLMARVLFGVLPTDPLTFAVVAVVLCLAALLASGVPAFAVTSPTTNESSVTLIFDHVLIEQEYR